MYCQTSERTGHQYLNDAALEAEQCYCRCDGDYCRGPVEVAAEAFRPKHVIPEEARQIEDHPNYGGGDGGKRCSELEFVVGRLNQRATRNEGKKVNQVTRAAATAPARNS